MNVEMNVVDELRKEIAIEDIERLLEKLELLTMQPERPENWHAIRRIVPDLHSAVARALRVQVI